jgi:hypothetical protein
MRSVRWTKQIFGLMADLSKLRPEEKGKVTQCDERSNQIAILGHLTGDEWNTT